MVHVSGCLQLNIHVTYWSEYLQQFYFGHHLYLKTQQTSSVMSTHLKFTQPTPPPLIKALLEAPELL